MCRSGTLLLACMAATSVARAAGQLHGTVETTGNARHTGEIQWGESRFWDEALVATRPLLGEEQKKDEPEGFKFSLFGVRLFHDDDRDEAARFVVPFGEIRAIVPHGREASIELRNGDAVKVSAVRTETGEAIERIGIDGPGGHIEVPWFQVRRIQFSAGPTGTTGTDRLWGTASTKAGAFTGLVEWEPEDEKTVDGELDGRAEGRNWSIEFGEIAAIAPEGPRAARVVLKSGRELVLSGTNDVNEDSRGLVIQVPGRTGVRIEWHALVRLDLLPIPGLPALDRYGNGRPIRGTVRLRDGTTRSGRIAWDRDESYTFETLDGEVDGIHWSIPFGEIASIRPVPGGRSQVRLRDGRELTLEGSNDVDASNRGVVVEAGDATAVLPIDTIASVDLD